MLSVVTRLRNLYGIAAQRLAVWGCGLSPFLHGEVEGGSRVTGRPEVISCRWVGHSAAEAPSSELSGYLLHVGQAHTVGGRSGDRWKSVSLSHLMYCLGLLA